MRLLTYSTKQSLYCCLRYRILIDVQIVEATASFVQQSDEDGGLTGKERAGVQICAT